MAEITRDDLLSRPVEHVDITAFDARPLVDQYRHTAFQARNLARAADIYSDMLADPDCVVILTLAGSLVSAGQKRALATLVEAGMVDVVVATGANVVDQDFFEAIGHRHYRAPGSPEAPAVPDERLRELGIDRIYDTLIDEEELRDCDRTTREIFDGLSPRPYSSRELMTELGRYLDARAPEATSLVLAAYRKAVPIFVPALSDSSAGFGIVLHQAEAERAGRDAIAFDSGRDFLELSRIKLAAPTTGLFMLGGGVPKNFAQDIVVAAEMLAEAGLGGVGEVGPEPVAAAGDAIAAQAPQKDVPMHRYAIQLTVADPRDGALSGSTLREATSWGKVDTVREQMVFGEASVTFPIIASDAYHRDAWRGRAQRRLSEWLASGAVRV